MNPFIPYSFDFMKNISPQLTLTKTKTGLLLQVQLQVPPGYELQLPTNEHSIEAEKIDAEKVVLRLLPTQTASASQTQTLNLPVSVPAGRELLVEIQDAAGKRVGGGGVVSFDDSDEK